MNQNDVEQMNCPLQEPQQVLVLELVLELVLALVLELEQVLQQELQLLELYYLRLKHVICQSVPDQDLKEPRHSLLHQTW